MMHYLLFYTFVEGIAEKRKPYRDEHLALARAAHDRGDLVMAGALREPEDGAVLVFRTERPSAIEDFARSDPYVAHGLVTEWSVRPWDLGVGG